MADVQAAIEYIFPLVYEFRKERTPEEIAALALKKSRQVAHSLASDEEEFPEEEGESDWD